MSKHYMKVNRELTHNPDHRLYRGEVCGMSKQILVIDDDKSVREMFQHVLQDESFEVDTCETGVEGLEKLKADNYDLVLLDLKMPAMNGIQTLREIRKINKELDVLIVTAFHEDFFCELQSLIQDGYSFELMRKPLNRTQIIQVAKSYLNHPQIIQG